MDINIINSSFNYPVMRIIDSFPANRIWVLATVYNCTIFTLPTKVDFNKCRPTYFITGIGVPFQKSTKYIKRLQRVIVTQRIWCENISAWFFWPREGRKRIPTHVNRKGIAVCRIWGGFVPGFSFKYLQNRLYT